MNEEDRAAIIIEEGDDLDPEDRARLDEALRASKAELARGAERGADDKRARPTGRGGDASLASATMAWADAAQARKARGDGVRG